MTNGLMMITDIYVCLYVSFIYISFADVAWEGGEKGRPPRPLRLVSGQKEMVASGLIYLVWGSIQGKALLNATSTVHLFSVRWQMRFMSPWALLKCIGKKGNSVC